MLLGEFFILHVITAATHPFTMNATPEIKGEMLLYKHECQAKRGRQRPKFKCLSFRSTDMHLLVLLLVVYTLLGDQRALLCLVVF